MAKVTPFVNKKDDKSDSGSYRQNSALPTTCISKVLEKYIAEDIRTSIYQWKPNLDSENFILANQDSLTGEVY